MCFFFQFLFLLITSRQSTAFFFCSSSPSNKQQIALLCYYSELAVLKIANSSVLTAEGMNPADKSEKEQRSNTSAFWLRLREQLINNLLLCTSESLRLVFSKPSFPLCFLLARRPVFNYDVDGR